MEQMDLEQKLAAEAPEARSAAFTDVDVSKDGWSFEGLAAVYDQEADIGDFTESQARGTYRKVTSRSDNVPMLYHHNPMLPVLATTRAGTLTLRDDVKGLRVKADIARHYVGEAVRELVKRGDITGMSTGMIVGRGNSRLERRGAGKPHRTITDLKALLDVSPTWDPAYLGTTAELRSLRAMQVAEDLDVVQQLLPGAVPQQEQHRAPDEENAETAEPGPDGEQQDQPANACEKCGAPVEDGAEHDCEPEEEQRSGVTAAAAAAAARRRRLHMMGLTLPRDVRPPIT